MKLTTLVFALLTATISVAHAADLSQPMILVAKPELIDRLYGSTVLVVTPIGGDRHAGFIVNQPTNVTLGELVPEGDALQSVVDPVYLGGPTSPDVLFALVERKQNPGHECIELMPDSMPQSTRTPSITSCALSRTTRGSPTKAIRSCGAMVCMHR